MKKVYFPLAFVLLAMAFILFNLLNNSLFSNTRADFTEGKLFTLSDGTRNLLSSLEEPVNLYFYFSDEETREMPQLRSYSSRVQSLLEEYELIANGMVNLKIINPEAFSEAQDQADAFGLTGIRANSFGDSIYFGLAGTNLLDDKEIIPFFQSEKESYLEYEISQMIHKLANPEPKRIAIFTGMPMAGEMNFRMEQPVPPWQTYQMLNKLYDTEILSPDFSDFDPTVDLLLLVQPPLVRSDTEKKIDQFVMNGGKVLVFVDPLIQGSQLGIAEFRNPGMQSLLYHWGLMFSDRQFVAEANLAMAVASPRGGSIRHFAVLSVPGDQINDEDISTSNLENLNLAMAGNFSPVDGSTTTFSPLVQSTELSSLMPTSIFQMIQSPQEIAGQFTPTPDIYNIGVRVSGPLKSLYADSEDEDIIKETDNVNIVAFSDVDMLLDWIWVRPQQVSGQQIFQPWADNGSLLINTVDNLVGSSDLITLRSRGQYDRPFEVVADLRASAEERFRANEQALLVELQETESRVKRMQTQDTGAGDLGLNQEQQKALMEFQKRRIEIRKELRDVRHQLDKDIETLGSQVKLLNIAIMPLLLTLSVYLILLFRRKLKAVK